MNSNIKNRGISIITNFGCKSNCWYCIMKNHKLKNEKNSIDYEKLKGFLTRYKHLGKVSVSGGGDPLFEYSKNLEFWNWLSLVCKELNIKIDVHTREKLMKKSFWKKNVNLCAFSSDDVDKDIAYLRYLNKLTKLRIVHVAKEDSSDELIEKYIALKKELNCQLTIKQIHGWDDGDRFYQIEEKYNKDAHFLKDGDYNIYYMPNNTISERFMI